MKIVIGAAEASGKGIRKSFSKGRELNLCPSRYLAGSNDCPELGGSIAQSCKHWGYGPMVCNSISVRVRQSIFGRRNRRIC